MPVANINLSREARRQIFRNQIVMATATLQAAADVDMECDRKILSIQYAYVVASNTGTWQAIEVGTVADPDHYLTAEGENSKTEGYVKEQTVLNPSHLIAAGTTLVIRRANTTAGSNVAVIDVHVVYERIDKNPIKG